MYSGEKQQRESGCVEKGEGRKKGGGGGGGRGGKEEDGRGGTQPGLHDHRMRRTTQTVSIPVCRRQHQHHRGLPPPDLDCVRDPEHERHAGVARQHER